MGGLNVHEVDEDEATRYSLLCAFTNSHEVDEDDPEFGRLCVLGFAKIMDGVDQNGKYRTWRVLTAKGRYAAAKYYREALKRGDCTAAGIPAAKIRNIAGCAKGMTMKMKVIA